MIRIGQRLQKERARMGLSLEEISEKIKIKSQFLSAIEKGEYDKLPSPAYAKGFVRNYAAFLGLPEAETVAFFKRDFDEKKALKVLPDGVARKQSFSLKRMKIRQFMLAGFVILGFLIFIIFQFRAAFIPPQLDVTSPVNGDVVESEFVVRGVTDEKATVFVNDEPVAVGVGGNFSKVINLFPGEITLTIKATNRMGREAVVEKQITVR